MRVRLRQAATVDVPGTGHHWFPPGSEVDIPDHHFEGSVHEAIDVPEAPEQVEPPVDPVWQKPADPAEPPPAQPEDPT